MGVSLLMLIPTQRIEADWELITVRVGGQAVSVAVLCHLRRPSKTTFLRAVLRGNSEVRLARCHRASPTGETSYDVRLLQHHARIAGPRLPIAGLVRRRFAPAFRPNGPPIPLTRVAPYLKAPSADEERRAVASIWAKLSVGRFFSGPLFHRYTLSIPPR
jgi:hypothetical protein